MSLEKSIDSGKEYRNHYKGSKRFSLRCRNHGGCEWCLGNRLHKFKKKELESEFKLKNYEDNYDCRRTY